MSCQLLNTIVPEGAIVVEACGTHGSITLFPEELSLLENASEKRRTEFSLGRSCAHLALGKLGAGSQPVLRGAFREPIWPAGVVGSITHCDGYCAAAVARKSDIAGFGIDAELIRPVTEDVLRLIATEPEAIWIRQAEQSAYRSIPWTLVLFSAKESVFKTWFPMVGTWLGFEQVRVEFDENDNGFRAFISASPFNAPRELRQIQGRFIVAAEHVMTCAYVGVN